MKKIRIGTLICALFIPLAIGMISAALSAKGMEMYGVMEKPPLSPPPWVFSVAWTILYLMMGLASYFVYVAEADRQTRFMALCYYTIQLIMNFLWSIVFFNFNMYLLAFLWLLGMWCIVVICTFRFYGIEKIAGYLLIPYNVWLAFAAYLNLGAFILDVT